MNRYQILNIIGEEMTSSGMEVDWAEGTQTEDNTTPHAKQIINHPSWNTDTNIASLSTDLFQQLKKCQQTAQDAGELGQSAPTYKQPTQAIKMTSAISQRIRFNLIRHRDTLSDIPSCKLFKSFFSTLRNADPTLVILPYSTAKQHYSSLTNLKQIQEINDAKLLQFFKALLSKTKILN